jgi:hypothetical protein
MKSREIKTRIPNKARYWHHSGGWIWKWRDHQMTVWLNAWLPSGRSLEDQENEIEIPEEFARLEFPKAFVSLPN